MINLELYNRHMDAVAKAQADRATIAKFIDAGGQHRLAISAKDGDPAGDVISTFLGEVNGFQSLLTAMLKRAENKINQAETALLEIAQGDVIARGVEDDAI